MTFDIFTAYATDENLEKNGTKFPFGGKGNYLLIARAGNRAYSKALTKAVELRRVELDTDDESSDAASDAIMAEVMADTILLGWGTDPTVAGAVPFTFRGAAFPYSRENAITALKVKEFRKHVAALSDDMDAYKFKQEVATGNV